MGEESQFVRRKLWLRVFEITVYALILGIFGLLTAAIHSDYWMLSLMITWLGLSCFMTLLTLLSWRHINKSSEALD